MPPAIVRDVRIHFCSFCRLLMPGGDFFRHSFWNRISVTICETNSEITKAYQMPYRPAGCINRYASGSNTRI